jgi:hypothetical protein
VTVARLPGWLKFAIAGSTYARALRNAAQRSGGRVAPQLLSHIAAQPRAQPLPGLAEQARTPGALAPTPHQQGLQKMMARVPYATDEHNGDPNASATFQGLLRRRGMVHTTPAGQMTPHAQLMAERQQASAAAPTRVGPAPAPGKQRYNPGGDLNSLMDPKRPNPWATGMPEAHAERPPVADMLASLRSGAPAAPAPANMSMVAPNDATNAITRRRPRPPMPAPSEATGVMQRHASALPWIAGAAAPLALGAGLLLSKRGIRADLADRLHGTGDIHQKDVAQAIPANVQDQAARATQALAERGINPAGLRIAVDAPSGAGKTVLSKALAQQMGLRHHGLDWRPNLLYHQVMGGGDIENTPYAPHAGEIVEHQQLLRSYDPELFDVAIHIHKNPEEIRQQVLKRGRGARTYDLLNYDKSVAVGRKAFETLEGEAVDLGGGVMMKTRPSTGWGNNLERQLEAQGVDHTGLSRHEKLLSLHHGTRTTGKGWTPYVQNPFSAGEMTAMAASVPLGVMAARALTRR